MENQVAKNTTQRRVFIVGPSGTGKSTYAASAYPNALTINARSDLEALTQLSNCNFKTLILDDIVFTSEINEKISKLLTCNIETLVLIVQYLRTVPRNIRNVGDEIHFSTSTSVSELKSIWENYGASFASFIQLEKYVGRMKKDGTRFVKLPLGEEDTKMLSVSERERDSKLSADISKIKSHLDGIYRILENMEII